MGEAKGEIRRDRDWESKGVHFKSMTGNDRDRDETEKTQLKEHKYLRKGTS